MVIQNLWLGTIVRIWTTVSSRVRELQTNQKTIIRPDGALVCSDQRLSQTRQIVSRLLIDNELVRISTTIMSYGNSFAAPDQFRTTRTKPFPTTKRQLGRTSIARAIPSFHRLGAAHFSHLT